MEQTEKKKLEMRKLSGQDLYPVLGMMGKLGVKDMVTKYFKTQKEMAQKNKGKETVDNAVYENAGLNFMGDIVETALMNIDRIRTDLNRLLADLCGVKVSVIEGLEIDEYTDLIFGFFAKPELGGFFKSIGSFMSR